MVFPIKCVNLCAKRSSKVNETEKRRLNNLKNGYRANSDKFSYTKRTESLIQKTKKCFFFLN